MNLPAPIKPAIGSLLLLMLVVWLLRIFLSTENPQPNPALHPVQPRKPELATPSLPVQTQPTSNPVPSAAIPTSVPVPAPPPQPPAARPFSALDMETVLAGLSEGDTDGLGANLDEISRCDTCLGLLKTYLLSANLSRRQTADLVALLGQENSPALALLLVSVAEGLLEQDPASEQADAVLAELASYDSPLVSGQFIRWVLDKHRFGEPLPTELAALLQKTVCETSDRQAVADSLWQHYQRDFDLSQRGRVIGFKHPETLARIAADALELGDGRELQSSLDALASSHDRQAFTAFLQIQANPAASQEQARIQTAALRWAQQFADSDMLDWMEQVLWSTNLPPDSKALVLDMMAASVDQDKASKIMASHTQTE